MSARGVDAAIPTRLSSIRNELIGQKLRVVGRILVHDVKTSTVVLWNEKHAIAADISLCLPTAGGVSWLQEPRGTVTVLGYLERSQPETPLPRLPAQLPDAELVLIPHVSLQAILVLDSPDVDIRLWNATVAEMEASGLL
ncbi:hypothetical protein BC834DRAFT_968219 [Gloeopeniophorella convolvens]|nr:hypothetical protein BC834DRAFT_968219 [Gloeopeniophorella convolvens]